MESDECTYEIGKDEMIQGNDRDRIDHLLKMQNYITQYFNDNIKYPSQENWKEELKISSIHLSFILKILLQYLYCIIIK